MRADAERTAAEVEATGVRAALLAARANCTAERARAARAIAWIEVAAASCVSPRSTSSASC